MIKYFFWFVLLGLPLTVFSFENNDIQIWSGTTIEKSQNQYFYYISEQVKWGGNVSDFYLHRTDGGISVDISAHVSASINYKIINVEKNSEWIRSHVPYLNLNFSKEIYSFEFSSRNRLEYWDMPDQTNYWRYRNRVKIEPILINEKLPVKTYIAEEAFVNFSNGKLVNLRTYLGIDFNLCSDIEIGLFYCLHQSGNLSSWKNNHAFCSSIKLSY